MLSISHSKDNTVNKNNSHSTYVLSHSVRKRKLQAGTTLKQQWSTNAPGYLNRRRGDSMSSNEDENSECSEVNAGTQSTNTSTIRNLENEFEKHSSRRMNSMNQIRATGVSSNTTVKGAEEVAELQSVDGDDDSLDEQFSQQARRPMPTNTITGIDLILDSGSTHHMVWNRLLLTEFVPNNDADRLNLGRVECRYGEQLRIVGYGNMWPLRRVLYVPGLSHNMISVKMLTFHG